MSKYDKAYWLKEIHRFKDERQSFNKIAEEANKVYQGKSELDGVSRRLNCFWSYIQTVLPAFYSAMPNLEVKQRKKVGNIGHACGAVILERNIDYALKEYFPFSKVAYDAIMQWLISGQGVLWARYDADTAKKEMEYMEDVEQDDGTLHATPMIKEVDEKVSEKAILESISYRDFMYQACINQNDIEWKGRRAYLTKSEVIEKFGKNLADKLEYAIRPETTTNTDKEVYEGKAEFKEIWCRSSEKVYWLSSTKDDEVIEEGSPPIKLETFFPCSVIDGYLPLDSVMPLSDYAQNKDIILEIERLTTRKHHAIQAIRFNATYDPILGDLVNNIFSSDYKMIPNPNWTAYQKSGGMAGGINFFDPAPYVSAVQFLSAEIEAQLNRFYDNTGASDLIRGATNPVETATAQQLKSNYSSLRFSVRQKQVYEFFNGAMNLLGEIISENFSPEKMIEVADGEDLTQKFPGVDLAQVIIMLKSDERRRYRIEITSDSLTQLDERQDRAERVDFIQSAGGFLNQMKDLLAASPAMMPLASGMLNFVLKSYKAGKEMEALFQQGFMAAAQELQQQKQMEQQNPMMQIEQQKLQLSNMDMQLKQQKMQLDNQIAQMQMQTESNKLGLEAGKQQFEQQFKTQELNITAQESQLNYAIETEKLRLESAKLQQKNELDAVNVQLKALQDNFDKQIQQAYLKLDEFSVVSKENEKLIEEKRLASQEKIETLKIISDQIAGLHQAKNGAKVESDTQTKPHSAPSPVINVHLGGKKRVTKVADGVYETENLDDGNSTADNK